MDFSLEPELAQFRDRVRDFIATHVLAIDNDISQRDEFQNIAMPVLQDLRKKVKQAGLWAPQMPRERGGQGLPFVGLAAAYEEMNRSIFGPLCFNCAAPDDGTMIALNRVLPEDMKSTWLQPIIDGDVQSAFAMTEPEPGAGSDPSMMRTRGERVNGGWRIYGRKWYTTGAGNASIFILIARTSDDPRKGLTAFLFHKDQPGWRLVRRIGIMGPEDHGGHYELDFDGLEVPDKQVLLNVGDGLKFAQIRLGPARLTHCMRWTGMARRALEIAVDYVSRREAFGRRLKDNDVIRAMLGDAAMEVETGRLLTMRAAWMLDRGERAQKEISMAKVVVSEALQKAVDTAIQLCGGKGYSTDLPLEWMYRYARLARLGDGTSEVHRMVIARHFLEAPEEMSTWG